MIFTRKLGKLLRGKATPFQLVAACVLGALLGFAPPFVQAPALYLILVALLLVVNANIGLALLVAGVTRLASWLLVPVSFQIGRFLLDGPASGLARAIVNAPVLAWAGLQYYAVSGGLALGLGLGVLLGLAVVRAVGAFRRRMARAAKEPSRWNELAKKPWARFTMWLFFGGTGKQTWEEKLGKRVGNPVRVWGLVLVILLAGGSFLAHRTFIDPLARRGMQAGLERANGATVDVGDVELDLGGGRLAIADLALADPNQLERNLFRATALEADVDQVDFLRRRLHVAKLVVRDAASGTERENPGERTAPAAEEAYEETRGRMPDLEDVTLEDVIEEAKIWRERLAQARRWIDRLSGGPAKGEGDRETFSERVAREAREKGWLKVESGHLVDQAPTFRLSDLAVDGFGLAWVPGHTFDLSASELSTHPWLVDGPPRVELASRDGSIRFALDLAPVSRGGGDGGLQVHWKGLSVDETLAKLKLGDDPPLRGGTLDLALDGPWPDGRIGWLDLPLRVTFHDTTVAMEDVEDTPIEELTLEIGLEGPLDAPRVRFDAGDFADALAEAGKKELSRKVRGELEEAVGEELEKAGVELPKDTKGVLEGVLGGKKKKDDG